MALRLSALRAGRTFTPTNIPGTHFIQNKRSGLKIRDILSANQFGCQFTLSELFNQFFRQHIIWSVIQF
jgi:hypothetical protein